MQMLANAMIANICKCIKSAQYIPQPYARLNFNYISIKRKNLGSDYFSSKFDQKFKRERQ